LPSQLNSRTRRARLNAGGSRYLKRTQLGSAAKLPARSRISAERRAVFNVHLLRAIGDLRPEVRIPTQSGRVFRFDAGRDSDLKPATIPN
jgi:hypothetical protein